MNPSVLTPSLPPPTFSLCEMQFGVPAPAIEADPVYDQACFSSQCSMAAPAGPCPKIDTDRKG